MALWILLGITWVMLTSASVFLLLTRREQRRARRALRDLSVSVVCSIDQDGRLVSVVSSNPEMVRMHVDIVDPWAEVDTLEGQ